MPFDPSAPYEVEEAPARISFDPTAPFEVVEEKPKLGDFAAQPDAQVSQSSPITSGELPAVIGNMAPAESAIAPEQLRALTREGVRQEPPAPEAQVAFPVPGGKDSFLGGLTEPAIKAAEYLANNPHLAVPGMAQGAALSFIPDIVRTEAEAISGAMQGDKRALGRAIGLPAMLLAPKAVKELRAQYLLRGKPSESVPSPDEVARAAYVLPKTAAETGLVNPTGTTEIGGDGVSRTLPPSAEAPMEKGGEKLPENGLPGQPTVPAAGDAAGPGALPDSSAIQARLKRIDTEYEQLVNELRTKGDKSGTVAQMRYLDGQRDLLEELRLQALGENAPEPKEAAIDSSARAAMDKLVTAESKASAPDSAAVEPTQDLPTEPGGGKAGEETAASEGQPASPAQVEGDGAHHNDPLRLTPSERKSEGWVEVWRQDRSDVPQTGYIRGAHWGTKEQAEAIRQRELEVGRTPGRLRHAFIQVKNPLETFDGGFWDKAIKEADANGNDTVVYENEGEKVGGKSYIPLKESQVVEIADAPPESPKSPGPGAAAEGEPGKYSAIEHLSDQLRTVPSSAKADPLRWRERMADKLTAGKSALARVVGRARATTETIKELRTGMRSINDVEREVARLDTAMQTSAGESMNMRKVIEKTYKNATMRRAAALYIDAGGDTKQFEEALAHLPKSTPTEVRKAIEMAANMPEEAKALADFLREFYGVRESEAVAHEVITEGLDDYFTHVWKKESNMPDKLRMAITTGKVNTYWQFARQRKISTFLEGIMQGKVPELDPAQVVPHYNFTLDRAIASRKLIRALSELTAKDERPAVAPTGKAAEVEKPNGDGAMLIRPRAKADSIGDYRSIDHPALRKWKWAGKSEAGNDTFYQSDLIVHPEFHERLANLMDRSRLTASKFTRGALRVGSEMKSAKFGLASTFHQLHVGLHAAFHWTNPFKVSNRQWVNSDGSIQFSHPFVQAAIEQGHLKIAPEPWELTAMSEGILNNRALIHKIPFVGEWSHAYSEWLFTRYIPKLKLATYEAALPRNLKAYDGKYTPEQIHARVGDAVNNAFGELNRMFLGKNGRNPIFQRALQGIFLAPDFGEARLRFVAKSLTKGGREERLALATMFVTLYSAARIGNWLSTGDPRWTDWKHAFAVKAGDHWYSMRSVIGDVDHAMADFVQFATVRLAPAVRTSLEVLTKRDQRGLKRSGGEQVADVARQFIPISLQGIGDPERKIIEDFSTSMGLSMRRDIPEQDAHQLVSQWMKDNPDSRIKAKYDRAQAETHAASDYASLRRHLREGDTAKAGAAYDKLRETKTKAQIEKAMEANRPLTGSWQMERQFIATLNARDQETYSKAAMERKQVAQRFKALPRR